MSDERNYKIFIGSSQEAMPIAELVCAEFTKRNDEAKIKLTPLPWWDLGYRNQYFLEKFPETLEECKFAIFILTLDDMLKIRGDEKEVTRDNVWFEAGMFIGKHGRHRTFFLVSKDDRKKSHFPSDMAGLIIPGIDWDTNAIYEALKSDSSNAITMKEGAKTQMATFCDGIMNDILNEIKKMSSSQKNDGTPIGCEDMVEIIRGTEKCFRFGTELIQNAKTRLYTSISFSGTSLDEETSSEEEKNLYQALYKRMERGNRPKSFKRYMNLNSDAVKKHKAALDELVKKHGDVGVNLLDINYKCIELIVSDNSVILAFPDLKDKDPNLRECVASCILVKDHVAFADAISNWLIDDKYGLAGCKNINCSECNAEICSI